MKNLTLLFLALTLLSCGYNLKTDREIAISKNQLVQAQNDLNQAKEKYEKLKDSLDMEALKMLRFKDSVEFTNLNRIMCYQSKPHRHTWEIFLNQFMTSTEESLTNKPVDAIYDQKEVAMND